MSIFDEFDEQLLKKKVAFLNDTQENFSKSESISFNKIRRKIFSTNHQIWKHEQKIGELELEIKAGEKAFKSLRNIFLIIILAITIIHYLKDGSVMDYGFTTLAFGGFFALGVFYIRTAEIATLAEISNLKISNTVLQSQLFEFEHYHLPNFAKYMQIVEEKGLSSNKLTDDEISLIKSFDFETNLAVISNMGYKVPTFWD